MHRFLSVLVVVGMISSTDSSSARAESPDPSPGISVFVGTSRGGDMQLHHSLAPLQCLDCTRFPLRPMEPDASLVTLGTSVAGRSGHIRGGLELFSIVAVSSGETSGYAGAVTTAGLQFGPAYAVVGIGLGTYVGGGHESIRTSMAGSRRAEFGVTVHRGWSVVARADSIQNDLSKTTVYTFGLLWSAQE